MAIDSEVQVIIEQFEKFKTPPFDTLSPQAARNHPSLKNAVEELGAANLMNRLGNIFHPYPELVHSITHCLVPSRDEHLLARIFRPNDRKLLPVIVYFHGGGWVISNLDVYESSCRALCNACQAIVISVAYRLAPENKFPVPANDAYDSLQWLMDHASDFGGDSSKVVVCGESAGGNLAAVSCLKALDEKGRMPRGQVLIYPVTDSRLNTPSMLEFSQTIPLNNKMMPWFWNHYLQNDSQKREIYAAPIFAENFIGLPPTLLITAEYDPLRDEGENYAQKLSKAGVPVQSTRYKGMIHEFFGLSSSVSQAAQAVKEVADWMAELFRS